MYIYNLIIKSYNIHRKIRGVPMQKIMSLTRRAVQKYNMISDSDVIAVGLSGGKDSSALLYALSKMRSFYPVKFDVKAVHIDLRFSGADTDVTELKRLCNELGVEFYVKRTDIGRIVFDERKESNPCSLCSRMRRAALIDEAKRLGCTRIALGHHEDDAVETFMMNLLNGGRIGCFSPVTYLEDKDMYLIRPLIFCPQSLITGEVRKSGLPVVKSKCPADGAGERKQMRELITELNRGYPKLREKIIGAMQRGSVDNW